MKKDTLKNIIKESIEEFGLPYDLGNIYEKSKEIEMRNNNLEQFAKFELANKDIANNMDNISSLVDGKLTSLVPNELIFFRNYANIFTSLIKFETNDLILEEQLIKLIRTAFYSGEAGLVLDGEHPYAVNVEKYENLINLRGDYEYVYVSSADKILQATKKPERSKNPVKIKLIYENGICKNFISFKWTAEAVSAWLWLWPYVLQKHKLQRQLALTTHFMNKKLELKLRDPSMLTRDLNLLLDPDIPVIINVGDGDNPNTNRVKWLNDGMEYTDTILNYINGWEALTEREFGLRNNIDLNTNKDRSLVGEVEASQSMYDNIEYSLLREWSIFIRKLKLLGYNINEVEEDDEVERSDNNNEI